MTYRVLIVIAVVLTGAMLLSPLQAQQNDGLKLGEKLEGELTDKSSRQASSYYATFPVMLKAGQPISIAATVVGKDRRVWVQLFDPTGAHLGTSKPALKATQYTHDEVSVTGKYTIRVHSFHIGPFTVRATGPSSEEVSIQSLETRAEQLRRELAEVEQKLKALKDKGGLRLPNPIEKPK